jgi:molybdenum cofactor sulfurtransferase
MLPSVSLRSSFHRKETLDELRSSEKGSSTSLFGFTGQSNITNTRVPLSIASYAKKCGYYTLLDAAALAPTYPISLRNSQIDAMAISFYKMFGYPTGVGALIMKREFAEMISRTKPWFAGGTVDFVQVPGNIVAYSESLEERLEEGSVNYLALPVIPKGLELLKTHQPALQLRLFSLIHWLIIQLETIRYANGGQAVIILSRRNPQLNDGVSEDGLSSGSLISMLFLAVGDLRFS